MPGGPDVGFLVPPTPPIPSRLRLFFAFLSTGNTEVYGCFRLQVLLLLLLLLLLLMLLMLRRARPEDLRKEDPVGDPPARCRRDHHRRTCHLMPALPGSP